MAYAVFPGDERYHVVKAGEDHTLCGLPTLTPGEGEGEHHLRALITEGPPPASLYHFCPQCLATLDSSKSDGPA
jgi:hypothetical protein